MRLFLGLMAMVFCLFTAPAQAAPPLGAFSSISDMEKKVGSEIMALNFFEALTVIDPKGRTLSQQKKDSFVNSLSGYYKRPLTDSALVREEVMGGGFRRALYAYWRDKLPIYFYVVTHKRGNEVWILQYTLETTFSKVINKF